MWGVVNDKDLQGSLPDPDRDYFDQCGSKFDYLGNLKEKGTGCEASITPVAASNEQPPKVEGFNGK
jgi:hypothetical protein